MQLKSQTCRRDVEVALKSNALLKAAIAKQEAEMQEMTQHVRQLEAEAKRGRNDNNQEVVKLIQATQKMKVGCKKQDGWREGGMDGWTDGQKEAKRGRNDNNQEVVKLIQATQKMKVGCM